MERGAILIFKTKTKPKQIKLSVGQVFRKHFIGNSPPRTDQSAMVIICREISPLPANCISYSPFVQVDSCLPSAASCLRFPPKNYSLVARCSLKPSIMRGALVTSTPQQVEVSTYPVIGEAKIGVLLLNLGGPETLEDVQPFLFNLFADPVSQLNLVFELVVSFRAHPMIQFNHVQFKRKMKGLN